VLLRYLGSKQEILEPLLEEVGKHCKPGDRVTDIFSGSLAVSLGLKRAGYRVTANDINLFSYVLGRAYLTPTQLPQDDVADVLTSAQARASGRIADALLKSDEQAMTDDAREALRSTITLQQHLSGLTSRDIAPEFRRTDFFDAYCEDGSSSAFISSRGRTGNRRFFTPANAERIDLVLCKLREWFSEGILSPDMHYLLLATLLRAVEKVSNTQGTYHDFPRTIMDSRALAPLTLEAPPVDVIIGGTGDHVLGREEDSLRFIAEVPRHSLLYVDPPYNFRQYSAYYFLPNVICRYPEMEDPEGYFSELMFVRGQNPSDDFTSTFCKASKFIDDLRTLIATAECDVVMISYFTGKNHWNEFDSDPSDHGLERLQALLEEQAFEPGSFAVNRVQRRNYASYGGFRARNVDELILTARKRQNAGHESRTGSRHGLQPVA
jgi:adenine-specific DNA methylase